MTVKTLSLLKKALGEASVHEINIETAETKTTSLYENPRGYEPGRRGPRETFPVSQLRLPAREDRITERERVRSSHFIPSSLADNEETNYTFTDWTGPTSAQDALPVGAREFI
ncbi:unnamed protein product [Vicia faba]|uniref:Uncharacterized protein n=1 Tax=Vicia faba TaxID=3906 RepID=A0AAV0YI90_VICFA|nr:unnamed protein product [Vicia faba]